MRAGEVTKTVLDDKVRRVLLLLERTGGLDGADFGPEQSIDDLQIVDRPQFVNVRQHSLHAFGAGFETLKTKQRIGAR